MVERAVTQRVLDQYLTHLRVERGLSEHSVSAYRRDLTRYLNFLVSQGIDTPEHVTSGHLENFVMSLTSGEAALAPASIARSVAAVRGWHRFLAAEGMVAHDASTHLQAPRVAQRLPQALAVDEVTAIIDAAYQDGNVHGLRDGALVELLYSTGARISEVANLDVDELDIESRTVKLFGKGRKERIVPFGSYAQEAVRAYLVRSRPQLAVRGVGTPALFLNAYGRRLSRHVAWNIIRQAAQRSGLTTTVRISPHSLRHSYATHMLAGGADIRSVQELLGHASLNSTQIYTQVLPHQIREVYTNAHPRARR